MVSVPAYCPTCGLVFPSGIAVEMSYGTRISGTAVCPKGHTGYIADGAFDVVGNIMHFKSPGTVTQAILERLHSIAKEVEEGNKPTKSALDEMTELLPDEMAAPLKKFGAKYPGLAFYLILILILGFTADVAMRIANAYKSFSTPAPTMVINNNITVEPQGESSSRNSNAQPQEIRAIDGGKLQAEKNKKEKARKKTREQRAKRKRMRKTTR